MVGSIDLLVSAPVFDRAVEERGLKPRRLECQMHIEFRRNDSCWHNPSNGSAGEPRLRSRDVAGRAGEGDLAPLDTSRTARSHQAPPALVRAARSVAMTITEVRRSALASVSAASS